MQFLRHLLIAFDDTSPELQNDNHSDFLTTIKAYILADGSHDRIRKQQWLLQYDVSEAIKDADWTSARRNLQRVKRGWDILQQFKEFATNFEDNANLKIRKIQNDVSPDLPKWFSEHFSHALLRFKRTAQRRQMLAKWHPVLDEWTPHP